MPQNVNNTTMPLFAGFQQEIDRIIEKAGAFFCEEEEIEVVELLEAVEQETIPQAVPLQRNAYAYAKYPALFHGKYSIPKHWVSDEDVAKVIIVEDTPATKKGKRATRQTQAILRHVYEQLAF